MGTNNENIFRVTLLGTGHPVPSIKRFGPCTLVEAGAQTFVFDAGRGTVLRLHQFGISLDRVTNLFLTHLHSDHIVGLPDLWITGWMQGRYATPLSIWGPVGTKKMMSGLQEAFEYDIHIRRDIDEKFPADGISFIVSEIDEGVVYETNGVKITAFEVDHRPIKPSFGYRIDFQGKSVVLSGDTRFNENLINYAKGVDLLVHEVGVASDKLMKNEVVRNVIAHHTTPAEAGEVFTQVKPKMAVFTHMVMLGSNENDILELAKETYSGPLIIGEDLMSFIIDESVEVNMENSE